MENMQVNSITPLTRMMEQLRGSVFDQGARDTSKHISPSPCPHRAFMLVNATTINK